ncbi:MAG: acyl-CoA thioesterase [Paracoccaceae bacterium]
MSAPRTAPMIKTLAMPADTNTAGDIFGGWVLSQMDIAGGITAADHANCRVVTVGIEAMSFLKPVRVGDILSVYTEIAHTGKTSIGVRLEAWVQRQHSGDSHKVTEGVFTFVALDEGGKKRQVAAR